MKRIRYRTGLKVPCSGIYTVRHNEHRLPHQVTLLRSNTFPRCAKCDGAVEFELTMGISEPESRFSFRVTLNELPELEPQEAEADGKAS